MKRLITHMIRLALGILPVILVVATAMAQKPVQPIVIDQCETLMLSVVDMPGDEYTWDFFSDSTANFASNDDRLDPVIYFQDGDYRDSSTVIANNLDPGSYFLRIMVWDEVACTNNLLVYKVDVLESLPEATVMDDSHCYGDPVVVKIVLTGKGPWNMVIDYTNSTTTINLNGVTEMEHTVFLPPLPVGTTEVWVQEIIDQCTENLIPSEKGRVVIFPLPTNSEIYPVEK